MTNSSPHILRKQLEVVGFEIRTTGNRVGSTVDWEVLLIGRVEFYDNISKEITPYLELSSKHS